MNRDELAKLRKIVRNKETYLGRLRASVGSTVGKPSDYFGSLKVDSARLQEERFRLAIEIAELKVLIKKNANQ
jgi:hypothetical protein